MKDCERVHTFARSNLVFWDNKEGAVANAKECKSKKIIYIVLSSYNTLKYWVNYFQRFANLAWCLGLSVVREEFVVEVSFPKLNKIIKCKIKNRTQELEEKTNGE